MMTWYVNEYTVNVDSQVFSQITIIDILLIEGTFETIFKVGNDETGMVLPGQVTQIYAGNQSLCMDSRPVHPNVLIKNNIYGNTDQVNFQIFF